MALISSGAFLGALFGASVRFYSAKFQKKRYFFQPWYLLGSIIIGGYVGANITQWGETAKRVSAERRAERGLPPFTLN